MNHLKWDSDIYQEYIASLQRMHQNLENEIQKLSSVKKKMLNENADGEDTVLAEVCAKLNAVLTRLEETDERIIRLCSALNRSIDLFSSTEKHISRFGMDMLYQSIERRSEMRGPAHSPVVVYSSAFSRHSIMPDWLRALVDEEQIAN